MTWPMVKLEDIFEIARGGSPRPIDEYLTDQDDGVNWISIKDASNSNKFITKTKLKIKPEGVSKSRLVKPDDFLLTNSMSFGRPYIMKTSGCIHDGWLVLSGEPEKVNPDYFYHLLGSDLIKRKFSALAAGAVVKNLNIQLVKGVEIPLPPLEEQKRIAAILDKADAIRRKRQQAIKLADEFLRSVFLDMFGDPVTNPKGWEVKTIEEVSLKVTDGVHAKPNYTDAGVPFISVKNIINGRISFDDTKFISLVDHLKYSKRCNVENRDIIYTKVGATYGRAALVETVAEFSLYVSVALIKPLNSDNKCDTANQV